ncbi:TetR/AcrR family transcriptional regulator [Carnobacterium funditum]|uniref:TetR/AcrR family transcriptional regulator n=1 Tax=Carnobacterium funditum TaxID=2752 RepID=UPI00054E6DAD|nr:TetR/AcrR family transcriptional regulator [Carnobacterium funditum]
METKMKITDSAFELFAKKGISFTLTEVAEEVGIKKASIYAHFESKEILLKEIIEKELKEYFFEINQENDDLKKIFFGVLDYYNNSHIKLLFWKRLLLLPPDSIENSIIERVHQLSEERFQTVKKLIIVEIEKEILIKDSEESICLMFFSLIHGLLSSELIYHPYDIREHYDKIWNHFWRGISNPNVNKQEA